MYLLLQELDDNLAELTREFEEATSAKLRCQQQAEATATTISLANRYSCINSMLLCLVYFNPTSNCMY